MTRIVMSRFIYKDLLMVNGYRAVYWLTLAQGPLPLSSPVGSQAVPQHAALSTSACAFPYLTQFGD